MQNTKSILRKSPTGQNKTKNAANVNERAANDFWQIGTAAVLLLVGLLIAASSVNATCTSQCNAGGLSGCKNWDSTKFPTTTYDIYTIEIDGKTYYYTYYFDEMGDAIEAVKSKDYGKTKPPASYNRPDDYTRGFGWWRFDRY